MEFIFTEDKMVLTPGQKRKRIEKSREFSKQGSNPMQITENVPYGEHGGYPAAQQVKPDKKLQWTSLENAPLLEVLNKILVVLEEIRDKK